MKDLFYGQRLIGTFHMLALGFSAYWYFNRIRFGPDIHSISRLIFICSIKNPRQHLHTFLFHTVFGTKEGFLFITS
jgi:hypothetical protein